MTITENFNNEIKESNEELKETFFKIYGNPSYDELLKMAAMKDLFNLTRGQKDKYIKNYNLLKDLTTNKDFEENKISITERIDYNLTLIKLLSIYGSAKISNYSLWFQVISNSNGKSIISVGDLIVLLEAFNKIKVSEYSKYSKLFFSNSFINIVYPKNIVYINSNETIAMIRKNLNTVLKNYDRQYDFYDYKRKKLVKSINPMEMLEKKF